MDRAKIYVRVQPRSSRNEVFRQEGDTWWIRLAAPPVEGKANAALVDYLAKVLGVPQSRVSIARGLTGRQKTVDVEGIADEEAHRRLREAMGQRG